MQRELYFRIRFPELANELGHDLIASRRDEANPKQTNFSVCRQTCPTYGLLQLNDCGSSVVTKCESRRREFRFTAVPLEEFDADFFLKRLDLERESWLAEMNQLCSTTEVQSFGDREKGSDVAEFHLTILFANQITGRKTFNFTNHIAKRVIGTSR
jgi:hypothetical protein